MPHTSDCATRSTTGHVSPPSAIPSVVPDILQCANVATRTVVLSVVSRIDCLPWHASFCSDRRCLIRTLADLPNNGGHYSKRAKTSRGHGEVSLFGRSLAIFLTALCSTRRRRGRHGWDALRPDQHLAVMARRSGQGMKPRAARACARPLTAPSTMTLRKQPNRARCAVNCRIHRSLERARPNSSAGYRPATLPLDSQVGSLAARPIASIGPRSSTWVETILSDRSLPRQAHSSRASGSAVRYPVNLRTVDGCEVADDDRPLVEVDPARPVPGL